LDLFNFSGELRNKIYRADFDKVCDADLPEDIRPRNWGSCMLASVDRPFLLYSFPRATTSRMLPLYTPIVARGHLSVRAREVCLDVSVDSVRNTQLNPRRNNLDPRLVARAGESASVRGHKTSGVAITDGVAEVVRIIKGLEAKTLDAY